MVIKLASWCLSSYPPLCPCLRHPWPGSTECYVRIYQRLSPSHQIFCMTTLLVCCGISIQLLDACYRCAYLRAWLQAPDLSPARRPWPRAATCTAPCDHFVRRSGAACCRPAIGQNRSKPFSILIDFKSRTLAWGAVCIALRASRERRDDIETIESHGQEKINGQTLLPLDLCIAPMIGVLFSIVSLPCPHYSRADIY